MATKSKIKKNTNCLTEDEKALLKQEVHEAWNQFPLEMKRFIFETKKQKLQSLYMIESWAKENGHTTIVELIAKRIAHKEDKINQIQKELGE